MSDKAFSQILALACHEYKGRDWFSAVEASYKMGHAKPLDAAQNFLKTPRLFRGEVDYVILEGEEFRAFRRGRVLLEKRKAILLSEDALEAFVFNSQTPLAMEIKRHHTEEYSKKQPKLSEILEPPASKLPLPLQKAGAKLEGLKTYKWHGKPCWVAIEVLKVQGFNFKPIEGTTVDDYDTPIKLFIRRNPFLTVYNGYTQLDEYTLQEFMNKNNLNVAPEHMTLFYEQGLYAWVAYYWHDDGDKFRKWLFYDLLSELDTIEADEQLLKELVDYLGISKFLKKNQ